MNPFKPPIRAVEFYQNTFLEDADGRGICQVLRDEHHLLAALKAYDPDVPNQVHATAWRDVCQALERVQPGWCQVGRSAASSAVIAIQNLAAHEEHMHPLQQTARAWAAVCEALNEVAPGWNALGRTGMESAVAAIKELAKK